MSTFLGDIRWRKQVLVWAAALLLGPLSAGALARPALAGPEDPPPAIDHIELTDDDLVVIWYSLEGISSSIEWGLTYDVLTPGGEQLYHLPFDEMPQYSPVNLDFHHNIDLRRLKVGPLNRYGRGTSKNARYCFKLAVFFGGNIVRTGPYSDAECVGTEPQPALPLDLWVSKIEVTQGQGIMGCLPGKSNIVVASVSNAGDSPVNASIPVELKVDGDVVQTRTMGGIEKQQTRVLAFEGVNIPAGGHVLTATVDPTGQFSEARENNNATPFNVTCTAPKSDLAVTRVTGPVSVADDATAAYEVVLWNEGAPAIGTAQVLIGFMGPLAPDVMLSTPGGFTCEKSDLGFSCTGSLGGKDDPTIERGATFQVRARGNGTGKAAVYGSANHARSLDEVSVDDNLKLLDVTVQ